MGISGNLGLPEGQGRDMIQTGSTGNLDGRHLAKTKEIPEGRIVTMLRLISLLRHVFWQRWTCKAAWQPSLTVRRHLNARLVEW